jgi:hypothetical protein
MFPYSAGQPIVYSRIVIKVLYCQVKTNYWVSLIDRVCPRLYINAEDDMFPFTSFTHYGPVVHVEAPDFKYMQEENAKNDQCITTILVQTKTHTRLFLSLPTFVQIFNLQKSCPTLPNYMYSCWW